MNKPVPAAPTSTIAPAIPSVVESQAQFSDAEKRILNSYMEFNQFIGFDHPIEPSESMDTLGAIGISHKSDGEALMLTKKYAYNTPRLQCQLIKWVSEESIKGALAGNAEHN